MNPRFKFNLQFNYPDLKAETDEESGKRVYYAPGGPVSSVTTVLGHLPHPGLDAWKERVGPEEAKRESQIATTIGTHMHNMLEHYVLGTVYECDREDEYVKMATLMHRAVQMFGLKDVDEIWGVETALYIEGLYAGRTDLVGIYSKKPSIVDYKSSKWFKKDEYIEDYKLQTAAYALAHDNMFGTDIEQGVLLIGTRPHEDYGLMPRLQKVYIPKEELDQYKLKWLQVLEDFHAGKYDGTTDPASIEAYANVSV